MVAPVPQPDDDKYEYNRSADNLVYNSALKKYFATSTKQAGNDPVQHERAIRLL